jgi:pimeloyl-ACP methyl ester carboxylesterase
MIRTSLAVDRYTIGEEDVIAGAIHSWAGDQPNGVIYCHGGNDLAASVMTEVAQRDIVTAVARHATVHAGDLGGNTFGNNTGLARVEEAVAYLRAEWGQDGPLGFIGGSMGFITSTVYALNHPEDVLFIAGIIPGIDLADLYIRGYAGMIDAAYPPAYNDATDGPTHSPIQFVDDLSDELPIHLWTASDDLEAVPATADAFVAARPQTGRTDLGALGHTDAAVAAAVSDVVAWAQSRIYA